MIQTLTRLRAAFALALVTSLVACGDGDTSGRPTGSVRFELDVPEGQTVQSVDLKLVCAGSGVDITRTLQVQDGRILAVFGGLAAGECVVTLGTKTGEGFECQGSKTFSVVPASTVDVQVTLLCSGISNGGGGARVRATVAYKDCSADRIKTIYAAPADVLLGSSTAVNVLLHDAAVVGTPSLTWSLRNDAAQTAQGTLGDGTCHEGAFACKAFTCSGLGTASAADPFTGLPAAGVFVSVTYEDDDCLDTEEVWLSCLQANVCGDGQQEGTEACDDGNTTNNDGCSSTCAIERCGDGIVQTGEACDGTAGLSEGQGCTPECQISSAATCGDGAVNQASEQCDGDAGLEANQLCSDTCTIVPICGNGVVEGAEECDDSMNPACVECKLEVQENNLCLECIATRTEVGEFNATVCQPDALCASVLSCILASPTCWTAIAPAACYCGNSQAKIDECENPSFVPEGDCAAEMKAGAGNNPVNTDVLARYFDFNYPMGNATVIVDEAFLKCNAECF